MYLTAQIKQNIPNEFFVVAFALTCADKQMFSIACQNYSQEQLLQVVCDSNSHNWLFEEHQKIAQEQREKLAPFIEKKTNGGMLTKEEYANINAIDEEYNSNCRCLNAVKLFEEKFSLILERIVLEHMGQFILGKEFEVDADVDFDKYFTVYVKPREARIDIIHSEGNERFYMNGLKDKLDNLIGRTNKKENNQDDDWEQ